MQRRSTCGSIDRTRYQTFSVSDGPSHDWRAPAVDVDRGAGDVGSGIRRKEARKVRELLCAADAAQRNVLGPSGHVVRERNAGSRGGLDMLVRLDEADEQPIDQHVIGRALP